MLLAPFQVIESETRPTIERRTVCRPAWYDEAINRLVVAAIRQAIIDVQRPVSDKDIPDAAEFLRCEALLWLDAVIPDNGIEPEIWREWVDRGCPLSGRKLGFQDVFTGEDAGEENNQADDLEDILETGVGNEH